MTTKDDEVSAPNPWDWVLPALLLPVGLLMLHHGLSTIPARYHLLRSQGVPVRVHIHRCPPTRSRPQVGPTCAASTEYGGITHRFTVSSNYLPAVDRHRTIPGLVDPDDPRISAPKHDVVHQARSGWFGGWALAAYPAFVMAALFLWVAISKRWPLGRLSA